MKKVPTSGTLSLHEGDIGIFSGCSPQEFDIRMPQNQTTDNGFRLLQCQHFLDLWAGGGTGSKVSAVQASKSQMPRHKLRVSSGGCGISGVTVGDEQEKQGSMEEQWIEIAVFLPRFEIFPFSKRVSIAVFATKVFCSFCVIFFLYFY